MRYISFLAVIILLSSCRPQHLLHVSAGHDPSEPNKGNFIRMKDGSSIKLGADIEVKSSGALETGVLGKLKVNGQKINTKKIESFQISGDYYKSFMNKNFARRIYKGPLSIYSHTNVVTTTSTSSSGSMHSSTHYVEEYFLEKDKVNKGELYQIGHSGKQLMLTQYLGDYRPSMEIYNEYRQKRHVNRIVRFATLGLWLSSIPMLALAKSGSTLEDVGLANAALGVFYVPAVTLAIGNKNRARPYKAVQKYIDNYLPDNPPVKNAPKPADQQPAQNETATQTPDPSPAELQNRDFLVVNGKTIVADEGSGLRSANNKRFTINGNQYAKGISAFQINKKYYRKFPDIKSSEDFAQRTINGKISVFNLVETGSSQARYNVKGHEYVINPRAQKTTYFVKNDGDNYIKGFNKLQPYFEDNNNARGIYSSYMKQNKSLKIQAYAISALGLAGLVYTFSSVFSGNRTGMYIGCIATTGLGYGGQWYLKTKAEKNHKQFIEALNVYNGTNTARR